jgi:hypothetical protein
VIDQTQACLTNLPIISEKKLKKSKKSKKRRSKKKKQQATTLIASETMTTTTTTTTSKSVFLEHVLRQNSDFDFNDTTKLIGSSLNANHKKGEKLLVVSDKNLSKETIGCSILNMVKTAATSVVVAAKPKPDESTCLNINSKLVSKTASKPHVPVVKKFFDAIKTTMDKVSSNINKVIF